MPKVKIDYVVSFSSEDSEHPASNLVASEISKKRWVGANKGEPSNSVVLQLAKSVQITSVHIGSYDSAFIEVLVGRSETPNESFKVLIPSSVFMTPIESKKGEGTTKLRTFNTDQLSADVRNQSWDRVRIVCRQPYNKHCKYGLVFIQIFEAENNNSVKVHSSEKPSFTKNNNQRFEVSVQSSDEEEAFKPGELFAKLKNSGSTLSTDSQIRLASTPEALKAVTDLSQTIVKTPISKEKAKNACSNQTSDEKSDRHRNNLLYTDDDEKINEKIDKIIQRDKEEKEKKRIEEKKREIKESIAKEKHKNESPKKHSDSSSHKNESNSNSGSRERNSNHKDDRKERSSREERSNKESNRHSGSRDRNSNQKDDRKDRSRREERNKNESKRNSSSRERNSHQKDDRKDRSTKEARNKNDSHRKSGSRERNSNHKDDRKGKLDISRIESKKRPHSSDSSRTKNAKRLKAGKKTDSPHTLMSDVVFVMSGYVNPRRGKVRDMALAMGARYKQDWGPGCTHLICAYPNTPKLNQVRSSGDSAVVVTAEWIEECCKSQRRLPWQWFATEPKKKVDRTDSGSDSDDVEPHNKVDDECDTDDEIEKVLQKQRENKMAAKKNMRIESDTPSDVEMPELKPKDDQKDDSLNLSSESVTFVKDERIQAELTISDSETCTDEDKDCISKEVEIDLNKILPPFFDGYLFMIDNVNLDDFDINLIRRYIIAYSGDIVEKIRDGATIDFIISTEINDEIIERVTLNKAIVRPEWVWECHEKREMVPTDEFEIA